jgi:hypothetical protein
MDKLVSTKSDLGLMDVHMVLKWLALIRVLGSFSYKDLPKILAKFRFMIGGHKAELERYYGVSILDKDSISNVETKGRLHVGVNSPICLFTTSKDSFPFNENRRS